MASNFHDSIHISRPGDERSLPLLPPYRSRSTSPATSMNEPDNNREAIQYAQATLRSPLHTPPKLVDTTVETVEAHDIRGWPREPQELKDSRLVSVLLAIGELLVTVSPLYFIVVGILAAKLDGQTGVNNSTGTKVEQLSKLGPTIFPIVFAAVAGRSLKATARYLAERGMKIGVLELLLASQTVWGTFESQVLLQRFTVVGAHLFILWALSPLGGQASLRLLRVTDTSTNSTSLVKYLPTIGMSDTQMNAGVFASADTTTPLAIVNSLYNANLLAPATIKSSTQDTWGNVKIPKLEFLQTETTSADGWAAVPVLTSPDNFTALIGLPIAGTSTDTNTLKDFTLDYSFMNVECSPEWFISGPKGPWMKSLGQLWSSTNGSKAFYNNATGDQTSFFLDTNLSFDSDRVTPAYVPQNATTRQDPTLQARRNILFGAEYYGPDADNSRGYAIFYRNCTVWTEFVEARVRCESQECGVTAVRPTVEFADYDANLTPLDLWQVSMNLFKNLPLATGSFHTSDPASSELFIRGLDSPFLANTSNVMAINDIASDVFAKRLALLLNTYYQISLSPMTYTGNLPELEDSIWNLEDTSAYYSKVDSTFAPFMARNATVVVTTTKAIYACNFIWLGLLLASSSVLLLTGVAGAMLRYKCLAPDMMGFVTSLTYNNQYVKLPPGGGALGAMERARLLKDVQVKIGDATIDAEIGHVVFGTVEDETSIGKLSKQKRYL